MIPGYVSEAAPSEYPNWPRPKGHRLVVVDALTRPGTSWRLAAPGRRCRFTVGPRHATCKATAVVELQRGAGGWWGYCGNPEHLFGRTWDPQTQRPLAADLLPARQQPSPPAAPPPPPFHKETQ